MRLRNLKTILYGAAALMMSACAEEQLETQFQGEAELKADIAALSSAFTAYDGPGQEDTRTYVDEHENYETGMATMWRTKEMIGVYGSMMTNSKFTSTNSSNAGTVSFRGTIWGTPKYAYYPYSTQNNGVKQTAVKGNVPNAQTYDLNTKDIVGDYRAGVIDQRGWLSSTFTFTRLVSLLRITVNATGTVLEGDKLHSVSLKVNNQRQLAGNFTINLQTQEIDLGEFEQGDDCLTLTWANKPALTSGAAYNGYMTALPAMQKGDEITITVTTDKHIATIVRTSKAAFKANGLVNYPLTLSNFSDMQVEEIPQQEPVVPVYARALKNMKFTVADNPGKILARSFTVGQKAAVSTSTVSEAVCTIDTTEMKIKLHLPYLNNRRLVPTFELEDGVTMIYAGGEMVSGETEVDFAKYDEVALHNASGGGVTYKVELTNTGLPVVVVNQETGVGSTETDDEYKKASETWYKATGTKWQPKDADWEMTEGVDNFMVYNADGTSAISNKDGNVVEKPLDASTRVRGNVTQQMPKKSFAVKLDKKSGIFMNDEDPTNDLPAHKRWVLLANWKDRTMMRNAVAFGLANVFNQTFPNDGIAWNPSGQFVELVYNNVHVGTYFLCEQIKIDGNRLDIKEPYDKDDAYSGNPEDYGYLMESDDGYDEAWQFTTACYVPFLFKDDGNSDMLTYAQNLVRGIEDNLYKNTAAGYEAAFQNLDLTSLVDFLLIQELMMNSEIKHPKSSYWYINDGTLYAGPVWDFDWNTLPTSGNSEEGYSYTKSMLEKASPSHKSSGYPTAPSSSDNTYLWYPMLVKNQAFKDLAAERWNIVKGALSSYVSTEINAMATKLEASEAVNNKMWPIDTNRDWFGRNTYGMGGGACGDESMTFKNAVSTLVSNLNTRINGMNYVSTKTWPSKSYSSKR